MDIETREKLDYHSRCIAEILHGEADIAVFTEVRSFKYAYILHQNIIPMMLKELGKVQSRKMRRET